LKTGLPARPCREPCFCSEKQENASAREPNDERYAEALACHDIKDGRLRFVSTGKIRSGCHNARNVGFSVARGDLIGTLDADDLFYPNRLSILAPLAAEYGAAADNIAVVSEDTEVLLYRVIGDAGDAIWFGVESFLGLTAPLFPLVRRDMAQLRLQGVEYAEDVVANLRLIDRLGMAADKTHHLALHRRREDVTAIATLHHAQLFWLGGQAADRLAGYVPWPETRRIGIYPRKANRRARRPLRSL
jgi:glycosyltransferase involved in cell wall biosynthesis